MYGRINEIRALVPSGTPLVALTATATKPMRLDICRRLELSACRFIFVSPDRPNINYETFPRVDMKTDLSSIADEFKINKTAMPRIIFYCRSLNRCADLYTFFLEKMGEDSYYPPGAPKLSQNRLFGMFHSNTPTNNKEVILRSMQKSGGIVRIVFATVALGMGVNFVGLNRIIHYGAPSSIEDYFQESGRAGRSGDPAKSTVYWKPSDAPLRKDLANPRDAEIAAVRHYLENNRECRRQQLMKHFDPSIIVTSVDPVLCCDVCMNKMLLHNFV